jgi:hypothetical protein
MQEKEIKLRENTRRAINTGIRFPKKRRRPDLLLKCKSFNILGEKHYEGLMSQRDDDGALVVVEQENLSLSSRSGSDVGGLCNRT